MTDLVQCEIPWPSRLENGEPTYVKLEVPVKLASMVTFGDASARSWAIERIRVWLTRRRLKQVREWHEQPTAVKLGMQLL